MSQQHTAEPWKAGSLGYCPECGATGDYAALKQQRDVYKEDVRILEEKIIMAENRARQLAALNSELEANLAHADDAYTHYKELNAELVAGLKPFTYKFISGNSVTVDRAIITAEEWQAVSEALAKAVQS